MTEQSSSSGRKRKPRVPKMSAHDRFMQHVSPEPNSGCWLWEGAGERYGVFKIGRREYAHRASWRLFKGEIPSGQCVLHRCDVTFCVNPEHLFLGSQLDNINDMIAKGRQNWDALRALSATTSRPWLRTRKLTSSQVRDIRKSTLSAAKTGHAYSVGETAVRRIRLGKTYRDVV